VTVGEREKWILTGSSISNDPRQAVSDLQSSLYNHNTALVVFFCSSTYDLEKIGNSISSGFGGTPVIGCTSSGEIGKEGYQTKGICGISFSSEYFSVSTGKLDDIPVCSEASAGIFADGVVRSLALSSPDITPENTFGIMLIDGMSYSEERIARGVQKGLGNISMIGGSAGDDLKFEKTQVFYNGHFSSSQTVLAVVTSYFPFRIFRAQSILCGQERLVVTRADIERRIIHEINGKPALEEYARTIGTEVENLSQNIFSTNPLVVKIGDSDYVRSIQKTTSDGGLVLYCSIDRGVVLRVAQSDGLLSSREAIFREIVGKTGPTSAILAFDCIQCRLDAERLGIVSEINRLFAENNVIGFSTYGEQYLGIHINLTFTGIAFGGEIRNDGTKNGS
jgi:hypothetical protein